MPRKSRINPNWLPQTKASELVKVYAEGGVSVVSLDDLAVGFCNRGISWKYAHSLAQRFTETEGFSELRYKNCICVKPQKGDEMASTRRHRAEAEASKGMIPTVDNLPRYCLLTKNHCFLACLLYRDGRIPKDGKTSETWTLPPDDGTGKHKALQQVLQRGLNCIVLSDEIWENEDIEDIKLIISVDNQDACKNMGDHEVHAFEQVRTVLDKEKQDNLNPVSLFERVFRKVEPTMGGFTKKDIGNIFSVARTLPGVYGDTIKSFHFYYVNPSLLKMKTEVFALPAGLSDKTPWVKVALICKTYVCKPQNYVPVGNLMYCNDMTTSFIDTLKKDEGHLIAVNDFIHHCLSGCQLTNPDVFKTAAVFLIQCGRAIEKVSKKTKEEEGSLGPNTQKFASAEMLLIDALKEVDIKKKPFLDETKEMMETREQIQEANLPQDAEYSGPVLMYDESGKLKEDLAYKAAQDGIEPGTRVDVTKTVSKTALRREVRKGERGKVTGVENTSVSVLFSDVEGVLKMPRSSLKRSPPADNPVSDNKVRKTTGGNQTGKKANLQGTEADDDDVDLLADVKDKMIPWQTSSVGDHAEQMIGQIKCLLLHLVGSVGPKSEGIGFQATNSEPIALDDFAAQELKLFPYTREISDKPPKNCLYIEVKAAVDKLQFHPFYLAAPQFKTSSDQQSSDMLFISPFWNAITAAKKGCQPTLQYTSHSFEVKIQVSGKAQGNSDNKYEVKRIQAPARLLITVPYLINTVHVSRGTALTASAKNRLLVDKRPT